MIGSVRALMTPFSIVIVIVLVSFLTRLVNRDTAKSPQAPDEHGTWIFRHGPAERWTALLALAFFGLGMPVLLSLDSPSDESKVGAFLILVSVFSPFTVFAALYVRRTSQRFLLSQDAIERHRGGSVVRINLADIASVEDGLGALLLRTPTGKLKIPGSIGGFKQLRELLVNAVSPKALGFGLKQNASDTPLPERSNRSLERSRDR